MDFNMKYCQLSEDLKEDQYIADSNDKDKNAEKRKKNIPCSAQAVLRNKVMKNIISEKISNFCDMIDEKEEEKEDIKLMILRKLLRKMKKMKKMKK